MKNLCFIILSFTTSFNLFAQDEPRFFANLDEREVLRRLFDNANLIRNSDNMLIAQWKPNFSERMVFPGDLNDEMCYAEIDTVLKFSRGDAEYALFVFATYETVNNGQDKDGGCHACAPMLSLALFEKDLNSNIGWSIINFKKEFGKHGSWGRIGEVRLAQIGKKEFALVLDGYYMGHGYTENSSFYYELNDYSEIFSVSTGADNGGAAVEEDEYFSFETKVEILPSNDKYYRIQCTSEGTKYLYKEKKIVSADEQITYFFDEEVGRYVAKKMIID